MTNPQAKLRPETENEGLGKEYNETNANSRVQIPNDGLKDPTKKSAREAPLQNNKVRKAIAKNDRNFTKYAPQRFVSLLLQARSSPLSAAPGDNRADKPRAQRKAEPGNSHVPSPGWGLPSKGK